MAIDPMSLPALIESWGSAPRRGVFIDVPRVARQLREPDASAGAVQASHQLAMQFGDTGAPELCVIVAEHRLAFQLDTEAREKLEAQRHLALWTLGLATADAADIPVAHVVEHLTPIENKISSWRQTFLAPVNGDRACVVEIAIRIAAMRVELLAVPKPFTVANVLALPHPADVAERSGNGVP